MHYNGNDFRYNRELETTCYFPYEQESIENASGTSGTYMPGRLMVNNQERENEPMSFTGVMVCLDGVLAFGDSRSTLKDEFGTPKKENDTTRKVFKINDFIMTASGRNTIYVNGQNTTMEDFIEKNKERFKTPYDFIDIFCRTVRPAKGAYYFRFGVKNNDETGILAFDIIDGKVTYIPKTTNVGAAFYDTLAVYTRSFQYDVDISSKTTQEAKKTIEEWMKEKIKYVDRHYDYNYVGLPLQIEILKK